MKKLVLVLILTGLVVLLAGVVAHATEPPVMTAEIQVYPSVRVVTATGFQGIQAYKRLDGAVIVSWYGAPYTVDASGAKLLSCVRVGNKTTATVGPMGSYFYLRSR